MSIGRAEQGLTDIEQAQTKVPVAVTLKASCYDALHHRLLSHSRVRSHPARPPAPGRDDLRDLVDRHQHPLANVFTS